MARAAGPRGEHGGEGDGERLAFSRGHFQQKATRHGERFVQKGIAHRLAAAEVLAKTREPGLQRAITDMPQCGCEGMHGIGFGAQRGGW